MANSKGTNQGRPTKYKKRYCKDIVEWAELGELPVKWAVRCKVNRGTLNQWTNDYPDFSDAWDVAREISISYYYDTLTDANDAISLKKAQVILNLAFREAETQKIEATQEITANINTEVSLDFGDRADEQD